jgi:hypothetical protein
LTVIIDTNVLIAMLIKKGIFRELIINNPGNLSLRIGVLRNYGNIEKSGTRIN